MHQTGFQLDGVVIPSVTTVLDVINKPELMAWYARFGTKECERIKRESGAFGSAVHDGIEKALTGDLSGVILEGRAGQLIDRAIKWIKESGFIHKSLETHVVHKGLRYHGTFDALGYFKGHENTLWILDWKTSNRVDKNYAIQLAAYAAAYNHQEGLSWENGVNHGGILRLAKNPKDRKQVEPVSFAGLEEHFTAFKAARELYHYIHERE